MADRSLHSDSISPPKKKKKKFTFCLDIYLAYLRIFIRSSVEKGDGMIDDLLAAELNVINVIRCTVVCSTILGYSFLKAGSRVFFDGG